MNNQHMELKNKLKDAMIAKDAVRLSVIRNMITSCTNEAVSKGMTPQDFLTDIEFESVVLKLIKQRKDSIEQFTKGGREDLVKEEQEQLAILKEFAPKMMTHEEIHAIAIIKKDEHAIVDKEKSNLLMGILMKELKGKANGDDVKKVVEQIFNS